MTNKVLDIPAYLVYLNGNGGATDTLIALVENGPLWDGDVPSKSGRDVLMQDGLAVRIVGTGKEGWGDGYTAATLSGRDVYKGMFGGVSLMLSEAKAQRIAQRAVHNAHSLMLSDPHESLIPKCRNCLTASACQLVKKCHKHCDINLWG